MEEEPVEEEPVEEEKPMEEESMEKEKLLEEEPIEGDGGRCRPSAPGPERRCQHGEGAYNRAGLLARRSRAICLD